MVKCLGIYRERQNSPNREADDSLILRLTIAQLEFLKVKTTILRPEEADLNDLNDWDLIVPMCESYSRLMRLKSLGPSRLIINPPEAVLSCYRIRMMEAFSRSSGLLFPETEIRPVITATKFPLPAFAENGFWIKRGDVHNTCSHDVVFARSLRDLKDVSCDFESREITSLVLQRHVDGDLIKFYGVGPGQWFTWFYHDPQTARRLAFELEALATVGQAAAQTVGLEIFGGDAIVSPEGRIFIIDINSWPSFARVRAEAAVQIARHLSLQLKARQARWQ
jgi:hypothetical protein